MSDFYNFDEEKHTSSPYDTPEPEKKPKKKGSFGTKLGKALCLGLVFGLAAGGAFWGITRAAGVNVSSKNGGNNGMNVNIVRTSSTDVQTIKGTDVSDIVQEAMPSIVAVNTQMVTTSSFFGQTYSQEGSGAGSGIIMSESEGTLYILTNYHVIQDSTSIQTTFNDGSTADATVKGYDENADIAVLTVDYQTLSDETKKNIAAAVMGDSGALEAGNGAIAIGNALGYGQSVTTGSISAVDREVQMTDGVVKLIQTDAAINPGNSGGALVNIEGQVIGINSSKISSTSAVAGSAVEGMGFAIPSNDVVEIINQLEKDGKVTRPALGISIADLNSLSSSATSKLDLPDEVKSGVVVGSVQKGMPADGKLQEYDVITEIDGKKISSKTDIQTNLYSHSIGDTIKVTFYRGKDKKTVDLKLTKSTEDISD